MTVHYHINIFFSEDDGGWIADVPDLASCSAFGATAEEALREVERARDAWMTAARQIGKPVPAPAVYLGCKIEAEPKAAIVNLIAQKYPGAKVYQARRPIDQYRLHFDQV